MFGFFDDPEVFEYITIKFLNVSFVHHVFNYFSFIRRYENAWCIREKLLFDSLRKKCEIFLLLFFF